jgi:hypothetical protein
MNLNSSSRWTRVAAITFVVATAAGVRTAQAQTQAPDMPADYKAVLQTLGRTGDFKANVLKVNIPRNDLSVTVAGVKTPTPFGFGGWVAMTKGDGGAEVLMGDLVLTEEEVNPVMSALLDHGIDVTALHNHFFWEQPRLFYMHVHGMGSAADPERAGGTCALRASHTEPDDARGTRAGADHRGRRDRTQYAARAPGRHGGRNARAGSARERTSR